ncbi:hypothetical protein D3C81_998790 [compost metagenome]
MQRRDLVIELFAVLVEPAGTVGQYLQQGFRGDFAAFARGQFGGDFQQRQCTAYITVGGAGDF